MDLFSPLASQSLCMAARHEAPYSSPSRMDGPHNAGHLQKVRAMNFIQIYLNLNSGNVARHKVLQRMEHVTCDMFPDWHSQISRSVAALYLQHHARYDIWAEAVSLPANSGLTCSKIWLTWTPYLWHVDLILYSCETTGGSYTHSCIRGLQHCSCATSLGTFQKKKKKSLSDAPQRNVVGL